MDYTPPPCPYCQAPPKLVAGSMIYTHRPDLSNKRFWRCLPCDAYVGTHDNSAQHVALGRLANAELRAAKRRAHAAFDPLWKTGEMTRREAYSWLREAVSVPKAQAHIGMFDVAQCKAVVEACKERQPC